MIPSLSTPELIVFIVGGLFFICTICLVLLAAAAYRWTTRPSVRYPAAPVDPYREHLQVIGGSRVTSEERWAA